MAIRAAELEARVTVEGIEPAERQFSAFGKTIASTAQASQHAGSFMTRAFEVFTGNVLSRGFDMVTGSLSRVGSAVIGTNAKLQSGATAWKVLLGTTDAARKQLDLLNKFAASTPFEFDEVNKASTLLQTFGGAALNTQKTLTLVGDVASGVGRQFGDVAFWTGRMYDSIQSGKPIGEAAAALQEMGAMSGETRNKLEDMQKSGASASQVWDTFTGSMSRFNGMMAEQSLNWDGLVSTFEDSINQLAAQAGKPIFDVLSAGLARVNALLADPAVQAGIQAFAQGLADDIGAAATWLADSAVPALVGAWQSLQPALDTVATAASAVGSSLWSIANAFQQGGISGAIAEASTQLSGFGDYIEHQFPTLQPVIQSMREAFGLTRDAILTFVQALQGDWVSTSGILPLHEAIGNLGLRAHEVFEWMIELGLPELQAELAASMPDNARLINVLVEAFQGLGQSAHSQTTQTTADVDTMGEELSVAGSYIEDILNSAMSGWDQFGADIHNVITGTIIPNLQTFVGYVGPTFAMVQNDVREASADMQASWTNAVNALIRGANELYSAVYNTFQSLNASAVNTMSSIEGAFSSGWARVTATVRSAVLALPAIVMSIVGQMAAAGAAIVNGIISGVTGAAGGLMSTLRNLANNAVQAARDAIRSHSPSQVFADQVGAPIVEGITAGVLAKMPEAKRKLVNEISDMVSKAASAMSSALDAMSKVQSYTGGAISTGTNDILQHNLVTLIGGIVEIAEQFEKDGLEAASRFTDAGSKIMSLINSGIDVMAKLGEHQLPPVTNEINDVIQHNLVRLVGGIVEIAEQFEQDALEAGSRFAETGSKVISLIGSGLDVMVKLGVATIPVISRAVVDVLQQNLARLIGGIVETADAFGTDGLEAASRFTDTGGKIMSLIGSGLDVMVKLGAATIPVVSHAIVDVLQTNLVRLVGGIVEIADAFGTDGLAAAAQFADAGGKILGLIGNALKAMQDLSSGQIEILANDVIDTLQANIVHLVGGIVEIAADFETDGLRAATTFADAATRILAPIKTAIEVFKGLSDYETVAGDRMQALAADVHRAVYWMIDVAHGLDKDGVQAAAVFGDAAGRILAPIKTALDLFKGLQKYESVASERMQALAADIWQAIYWMTQIANGSDKDGTKAAAAWSESVGKIFSGLKGGIDVLTGLKKYETVSSEQMKRLLDDVVVFLGYTQQAEQTAHGIADYSVLWLQWVKQFADNYRSAVNTIQNLPSYPTYPNMPNPPSSGGDGGSGAWDPGFGGSHEQTISRGGGSSDFGALSTSTVSYNMTINTSAPHEPIAQDFRLMAARAGRSIG